jgi:hypothetical protein
VKSAPARDDFVLGNGMRESHSNDEDLSEFRARFVMITDELTQDSYIETSLSLISPEDFVQRGRNCPKLCNLIVPFKISRVRWRPEKGTVARKIPSVFQCII